MDEDQWRSFLLTFRQFLLNDVTNFGRICNALFQYCDNPNLQAWAAYARQAWNSTLESKPIKIAPPDIDVEQTLALFCNAGIFHSDLAKTRELEFIKPSLMIAIKTLINCLVLIDLCIEHFRSGATADMPRFAVKLSVPVRRN